MNHRKNMTGNKNLPSGEIFKLDDCSFEILADGDNFVGLGKIWIGKTLVRSGRLPLKCFTQTFTGMELAGLRLRKIKSGKREIRISLDALFKKLPVKIMRDHSFDPIHELGDWDNDAVAGKGKMDLVLKPAEDEFNGVKFNGFSYHWEYESKDVPLFWLYDMASWELDGEITGATEYSQSSCSAPAIKFDKKNSWTTEGILFFLIEQGNQNPVMTHNLPRWAGHGSFDFQFKGDKTLVGVFERVELIRSVLMRESGSRELKCFDKHIFDQTKKFATSAKKIMLNEEPKSEIRNQNIWTWISDEVYERARREFGLKEVPTLPILGYNYWRDFTVESYYKDLLPAAINLGAKRLFVDNLKKSAETEKAPLPGVFNWNMCCGHEFEISDKLGGVEKVKIFMDECKKHGIEVQSWTNNDQALSSPINKAERSQGKDCWYALLEDSRQKYGGAYMGCMSVLDMSVPEAWKYFVDSHIKIYRETGSHFFFDSFYNLAFMVVNYNGMSPKTMWRELLQAFKKTQDAGIRWTIESFGPFGQPMHGHPSSYNMETIFACYKVGMGNDYTTVPGKQKTKDINPKGADGFYYQLAHKALTGIRLFIDEKRVDTVWGEDFKQALADYHAMLPDMQRRYMQEDGLSVIWHDAKGKKATVFNFKKRSVSLPGEVFDVTAKRKLPKAERYELEASHTYTVNGGVLPTERT
jgi:hypothetical protein